jgi:hypothetical protein
VRAELRHGALTSLTVDGTELLAGDSFLVHEYGDDGGLWRLGNEMPVLGCALRPSPAPVDVGALEVLEQSALSVRVAYRSATALREARLDAGSAGLALALTTSAAPATTRTAAFALAAADADRLTTAQPGGFVERPLERVYTPTFWPAVDWLTVGGTAVLLRQSTGARMSSPGQLELMAVRNAQSEQCDVEGGMGTDGDAHRIEWRLERAATPADAARAALAFNRPLELLAAAPSAGATPDLPAQSAALATLDGAGVLSAIKPADRGDGVIVRVLLLPGPATLHLSPPLVGRALTQVDAAERDLMPLGTAAESLALDRDHFGAIVTLRLR